MIASRRNFLSCVAMLALAGQVRAHSLADLSEEFVKDERYFQAVDKEAPAFTLQDARGHAVSLTDFKGKVVVLNFIYTHCPDFCPLHAEKVAQVQKMVNITPMKDRVQFISITTDPTNDFGKVLTTFGEDHGLDPANWVFLTAAQGSAEDSTRQLAAAYGVEFKGTPNGDQIHGVVTSVIREDGRLVARFHGLKFQSLNLVKFINALTNDHHPHVEPSLWDGLKAWF